MLFEAERTAVAAGENIKTNWPTEKTEAKPVACCKPTMSAINSPRSSVSDWASGFVVAGH